MSRATTWIGDSHRTHWTEEEQEKARYIARRAIRLNRDPQSDIMDYMGMPANVAARAVEKVRAALRVQPRHWENSNRADPDWFMKRRGSA
jgi:hypothetical protein